MIKVCTQCKISKDLEDFPNYKTGKYGKLAICRICDKINQRNRYLKNREYRIQRSKEYKLKNKENVSEKNRNRYLKQREKKLAYQKQQRLDKPEYMKEYRIKNKEHIRQVTNKWKNNKIKTDLNFKIKQNIKTRIISVLNGKSKSASTAKLLGCSIEKFIMYLEAQFWKDERIDWITYGPRGWHLDHIKPCASFDLTDPEQQKKCFHYTNLQPLWWDENIAKADKY